MFTNKDLYHKIILYIGDVEATRPYFPIDDLWIPDYPKEEIYHYASAMIEGGIIDGFFAEDDDYEEYGYLIGGLTLETKYLYQQLKKLKDE
jgi:hypothetical protein